MNKIKKSTLIIFFICFFSLVNFQKLFAQNYGEPYTVRFPSSMIIKGILLNNISTEFNNIGDKVELIIPADILAGEIVCIPKNSKMIGSIIRMGKATQGKNGFIEMAFDVLQFPDGQELSMLGHTWTKNGTHIVGGEFTERINYKRVCHSILGIGDVLQLIPDGSRVMGKETRLLAGSEWFIVLDKDLIFDVYKD